MKYAILTKEQYIELNAIISTAFGYPDESGTIQYAPDPDFDSELCALPITAEIQECFPELIQNIELVEQIPTYEQTDSALEQPE